MKLIDILNNVNKRPDLKNWVDFEDISSELNLNLWGLEQIEERLTAYWVFGWCCTDTWVGLCAYYFDGKPVFFTTQQARKADTYYTWISKDSRLAVQNYLLELAEQVEKEDNFEYMDLDEDTCTYFKVNYTNQILPQYESYLNGKRVYVIMERYGICDQQCKVRYGGSVQEFQVDVSVLNFKFNVEIPYDY